MATKRIEDRLVAAQVAIENALAHTELQNYLAEYGYDLARIQAGQALYQAALAAQQAQAAEYGDQYAATDALYDLWNEANASYMRYIKVARVALQDRRGALAKLDLYGRRKQTIAGWIIQARQFYSNLLADADLLADMTAYGVTQLKLEAGLAQVDAVEAANHVQEKERGEAQDATKARDAALDALDAWMSDFIAIARVALEEHPQYLEMLGIVEPS